MGLNSLTRKNWLNFVKVFPSKSVSGDKFKVNIFWQFYEDNAKLWLLECKQAFSMIRPMISIILTKFHKDWA